MFYASVAALLAVQCPRVLFAFDLPNVLFESCIVSMDTLYSAFSESSKALLKDNLSVIMQR